MDKFYNIAEKNTGLLLLYGVIGTDKEQISSSMVIRELAWLERDYDNIHVRMNCPGGSVYEGVAILNAIANSKANITIYVDGIAGSIASAIALCGRPVKMSKYARMMLHAVSVTFSGNTAKAKSMIGELGEIENNLAEMYSKKMCITPEQVKAQYFDGEDHWIGADKALGLGWIEEIYDVEPLDASSTTEQLYNIFQNRLLTSKNEPTMFNKLKEIKSFENCTNEQEVLKAIASIEAKANSADAMKVELDAFKQKERDAFAAKVQATVQAAIDNHQIGEDKRTHFENLLTADFDNAAAVLEMLPAKKSVGGNEDPTNTASVWDARMQEIAAKTKR